MTLRPGQKLGPYEILSLIGAGGMGEVYQAKDARLERAVAIKILPGELSKDSQTVARFEQEARAVAALSHPNILAIYDVGKLNDIPYLVMELLEGETLGRRLSTETVSTEQALDYAIQIADGLAAAHDKGISHRDLKPNNVFISEGGRVKILDFGLAKVEVEVIDNESDTKARKTVPGIVLGTLAYMSPEQLRGQRVDHRTDIFSFGTLLYEAVTGLNPFEGSSAADTVGAILHREFPSMPNSSTIPAAVANILEHALEKSPERRFASCRELAAVLRRVRAGLGAAEFHRVPILAQPELSIVVPPFTDLSPERDQDVKCVRCNENNPAQAQFCLSCGLTLVLECPACRRRLQGDARFCSACGLMFADYDSSPEKQSDRLTVPTLAEGERRQLTVMFCDLAGSTRFYAQLDPEDLQQVVQSYQTTCAGVIQRFGGSIAQYLGDGLLIYFGYPQAHEDDALRAVRTGLHLLDAITALSSQIEKEKGISLALRIAIHTGEVVIGEMGSIGRAEHLAFGETPNIAARAQQTAAPNSVVITEATYQLVKGYFFFADPVTEELKGLQRSIPLRRVIRESGVQSRLDMEAIRRLTPLVGRSAELAFLHERWREVEATGRGKVILVRGEAGIGKSRLVRALAGRLRDTPHTRLDCRCSPFFQDTSLYPVSDLLERLLELRSDESAEEKLVKLEGLLTGYSVRLEDSVPLFAKLLSLAVPEDRYPPSPLPPSRQRQKTLTTLVQMLSKQAGEQPVLFVVEDLQWIDATTLALLDTLVEQSVDFPILILMTCRPAFEAQWDDKATQMTLERLDHDQVDEMLREVAGGKRIPAELAARLAARSDGVPLYVEEMAITVLESGLLKEQDGQYQLIGEAGALAIPATLQDALMARLDQLETAKGIAQLSATIGRSFSYELIREVWQRDEAILKRELGRLVKNGLLLRRGKEPEVMYGFKHALIQEAAYQSLLKRTRQRYHQQIARILEERFEETARSQPEILAHHYTEARLNERAVFYWQLAGQRAVERSANVEAISHFRKGLKLLAALPQSPERLRQELALQSNLGAPLMASKGFSAPDVREAFARAREICREVDDTPELFTALWGLRTFYQVAGQLEIAHELAEQAMRVAQSSKDPALLIEAHCALGGTLCFLGEFAPSEKLFKEVLALYDRERHRAHAFLYGIDPAVYGLSYSGWNLWFLGHVAESEKKAQQAISVAQEIAHPGSKVFALFYGCCLHYWRQEPQTARELAEGVIAIAKEQDLPWWLSVASILRGWALAAQEQDAQGVAQLQLGLAAMQSMGTGLSREVFLSMLAEAHYRAGRIEEGLSSLAEAVSILQDAEDRRYAAAHIYALKGELLSALPNGKHAEAESCFHRALEIGRSKGAKSWELRAAVGLGKLWQRQGRRTVARELLEDICGRFPPGSDTADLREGNELLLELAR